jgi:hypothetical protein
MMLASAVVAPLIPPKNTATVTTTRTMPPRMWPMRLSKQATRSFIAREAMRMLPTNRNIGTVIRVSLRRASYTRAAIASPGTPMDSMPMAAGRPRKT